MSSNFVACCTGKDEMKTDNTNRDACDDVHKDFFCQAFFVKSGFFLLQVLFEGRFFITKPVFSFFFGYSRGLLLKESGGQRREGLNTTLTHAETDLSCKFFCLRCRQVRMGGDNTATGQEGGGGGTQGGFKDHIELCSD